MVTASVCGIRATAKVPRMSSTLATVRLIPSTAIEPFSTRNGRSSFGMSTTTSRPAATPLIDLILVVKSTWPWTRWPSSRPLARRGSSTLTLDPAFSAPRLVRRSVSGTTSAKKVVGDRSTPVRQQPLTATLEPIFRRRAVAAFSIPRRLGSTATTLPTPLTIPVNISADHEIIAESSKVEIAQADCVFQVLDPTPADRPDRLATADYLRCDVCVDLVDEAFGKKRCV